jgi:predicted GIY-YIG superfamily endonuclease
MKDVYLLKSRADPDQRYIGSTTDVNRRLQAHNSGQSVHTAKHRPWHLVASVAFVDHQRALQFGKDLKSGSGRAFANGHFW